MNSQTIYFDNAAATPLDAEVLAAMMPYLTEQYYNPSSSYLAARAVRKDIENARASVAAWLGARPAEVIFTAGATEANNLAIHGIMQQYPSSTVIASAVEHDAILRPIKRYSHGIAPVDKNGRVDLLALKKLIDSQTVLVTIGYANNELGTIQPLKQIADIIASIRADRLAKNNPLPLFLHTDAAQATPYLDLHAPRLGVDLMTINGSKVYGPKQVGALYVNAKVQLQPLVSGGGQESGLRSGTENVAGIIGLATALHKAQTVRKTEGERQRVLRDKLQYELLQHFPDATINGDQKHRLPNSLNISFSGCDGERILMACDERGLLLSTGAACSANKHTGSHVLKAIGLPPEVADGSIRVTLGNHTTEDDIIAAVTVIKEVVGNEYERT